MAFRWRADDSPHLVLFRSSFPLKKDVGPTLGKISGSALGYKKLGMVDCRILRGFQPKLVFSFSEDCVVLANCLDSSEIPHYGTSHLCLHKWQSKTLFLEIFDLHSSIVKSVFDCRLSSVFTVCQSMHLGVISEQRNASVSVIWQAAFNKDHLKCSLCQLFIILA